MAESTVYKNSRLRVWLPAIDLTPDGEESFEPSALTVTVRYGATVKAIGTLGEANGVHYVDFAADELDEAGAWYVDAVDDGYKARISFRVEA